MKKDLIFKGVATALVTPFKNDEIDYTSAAKIIDFQINSGINALVIAGTTGEGSTLEEDERFRYFEFCKERTFGRVPLILSTGTNDTKRSIALSRRAAELGADALLVITPYYNKGTNKGVLHHYLNIANSVDLPIIIYNVPSRTGVDIPIDTIDELADCERIVGIKEATDSASRLVALSALSDRIAIYSGNDSQIYLTLALGGMGVVSVASNILPREILKITDAFFLGRQTLSKEYQMAYLGFIDLLFRETNPCPIKYAMSLTGLCLPDMRLPLTLPTEGTARTIEKAMREYGIL